MSFARGAAERKVLCQSAGGVCDGVGLLAAIVAVAATSTMALTVLLAGGTRPPPPPAHQSLSATWDYRPPNAAEMANESDAVVEAQVTRVQTGATLTEPESDGGIPTQRIGFHTLSDLGTPAHSAAPADFTLFQTGSSTLSLEGDPPYVVGEKYVIFLSRESPDPTAWNFVAPDGRLREDIDGKLQGLIEGPVATELADKTPQDVRTIALQAKVNGSTSPPDFTHDFFSGSCSMGSGTYSAVAENLQGMFTTFYDWTISATGTCSGTLNGEVLDASPATLRTGGEVECSPLPTLTTAFRGAWTLTLTKDPSDDTDDTVILTGDTSSLDGNQGTYIIRLYGYDGASYGTAQGQLTTSRPVKCERQGATESTVTASFQTSQALRGRKGG